VQVFIHIRLDQTSFSFFEKFAKAVVLMPEIEERYSLSGDFDTMIKGRVKNMKAYQEFMSSKLGTLPGVIQTRSEGVIEEHKT
ncbi:AsnC family transcriptional regulator, partial [Vibrio parahaemolyticus]|uniref:Lrp/AsnC ligand binding domain-containing protein n=1 Tax=Vibrio parahaemolyticus TaxID=670 RepID=UPI0005F20691